MNNEKIIKSHLEALKTADIEALLSHYADDATLIFAEGVVEGKDAIRAMLIEFTTHVIPPVKTSWVLDKFIAHNNTVYITWNTESEAFDINHATDTFIIENEKIKIQTSAGEIVPK